MSKPSPSRVAHKFLNKTASAKSAVLDWDRDSFIFTQTYAVNLPDGWDDHWKMEWETISMDVPNGLRQFVKKGRGRDFDDKDFAKILMKNTQVYGETGIKFNCAEAMKKYGVSEKEIIAAMKWCAVNWMKISDWCKINL